MSSVLLPAGRQVILRDEESAASETDSLLGTTQRKVKRIWDGFIDFACQGNILQIAFGLMYLFTTPILHTSLELTPLVQSGLHLHRSGQVVCRRHPHAAHLHHPAPQAQH